MLKSYNVFATAAEKKSKQVENKQGTLLSWVKPCTSDTEPGVVDETIRIKEQPESNFLANFPRTISQTSSLFRQSQHKRKLETITKGIVDTWSDLTCTKKYAWTEEPKRRGGGVNMGHSVSPPSHFMLATGLRFLGNCPPIPLLTQHFAKVRSK